MTEPIEVIELPLARIGPGGDLREGFMAVQAPWVARGVSRWIALVRPDGPWPVVAFGARAPTAGLLGTIVGVWAPAPLTRFDDLHDRECPGGHRGASRPRGGAWHFIAVTRRAEGEGQGIGRRLVKAALAWVAGHDAAALARTLSPAVGLAELLARAGSSSAPIGALVGAAADDQGRPLLRVLRLHCGAGAWLERVLLESRRDDAASAQVTLRFAYPLEAEARAAQVQAYRAWVADRGRAIAEGAAAPLAGGGWLVPPCDDGRVLGEPLVEGGASQAPSGAP